MLALMQLGTAGFHQVFCCTVQAVRQIGQSSQGHSHCVRQLVGSWEGLLVITEKGAGVVLQLVLDNGYITMLHAAAHSFKHTATLISPGSG